MRIALPLLALAALAACHKPTPPAAAPSEAAAATAVTTSAAVAPQPAAAPAKPALPAEVEKLAQRIESCEHFAGEEPYDAERGKFLREQVEAVCPGNRAALDRLRRHYAANKAVLDRLAGLDPPAM